jgi:hypothetical protein
LFPDNTNIGVCVSCPKGQVRMKNAWCALDQQECQYKSCWTIMSNVRSLMCPLFFTMAINYLSFLHFLPSAFISYFQYQVVDDTGASSISVCTDCPAGTYNPLATYAGEPAIAACRTCPAGRGDSNKGATSEDDCKVCEGTPPSHPPFISPVTCISSSIVSLIYDYSWNLQREWRWSKR